MRHTVKRMLVKAKRATKKPVEGANTLPERFYHSFESPTKREVEEPQVATLPERFYRATDPLEESVANEADRQRLLPRLFRRNI